MKAPISAPLVLPEALRVALLVVAALVLLDAAQAPGRTGPEDPVAVFPGGHAFRLEIARTPPERALGYMFRERVGPEEGMLFLFPSDDFHSFWMKNCRVPLDLIWLSAERQVVYIEKGVPPCHLDPCPGYVPMRKARFVLEIASGGAEREGLKIGDPILVRGVDLTTATTP